jgi:hypothetical protein
VASTGFPSGSAAASAARATRPSASGRAVDGVRADGDRQPLLGQHREPGRVAGVAAAVAERPPAVDLAQLEAEPVAPGVRVVLVDVEPGPAHPPLP